MKKIFLIFTLLTTISFDINAQSISYQFRMQKPQNQYFEAEMTLADFKEKQLDIKMPVWVSGSYLVREFSKNVNLVKASD